MCFALGVVQFLKFESKCSSVSNPLFVAEGSQKKRLALCVQPMLYANNDISFRLVEWFEMLRQQAYDKVFMYVLEVHPNIAKVRCKTLIELATVVPSSVYCFF